jgi:hypothetical protein
LRARPKTHFFSCNFFKFLIIETLDAIRIGIQPKMFYLDPESMNPDPKNGFLKYTRISVRFGLLRFNFEHESLLFSFGLDSEFH